MTENSLSQKTLVTHAQAALMVAITIITSKLCLLPSVLGEIAGESAFWILLILLLADVGLAVFGYAVAKNGGVEKTFPKKITKTYLAFAVLIYTFKFCAFAYEISMAAAGSLFEDAAILPILLLLYVGAALVGNKGITGVLRTGVLLFWACLVLLTFHLFFIGFDGNAVNLYPLLRPKNVGKGLLIAALWFGDPGILFVTECHKKSEDKKGRALFFVALALTFATVIAFYLLLIYTYGAAINKVGSAFARVLTMNAHSDELGALDWPLMIVWLLMSVLHSALLFAAAKRSFQAVCPMKHSGLIFHLFTPAFLFCAYYFLFRNKERYVLVNTSLFVALPSLIFEYVIPLLLLVVFLCAKHGNTRRKPTIQYE